MMPPSVRRHNVAGVLGVPLRLCAWAPVTLLLVNITLDAL